MPLPTIKNRRDFLAAQNNGAKFITHSFILRCILRPADHPVQGPARFGFTVTKKLGGAVERNRIKRRLREAVRLSAVPHAKPGHDYVLIARHKVLTCEFSELLRDISFAFARIHANKNAQTRDVQ